MSVTQYKIDSFLGINQSVDENLLPNGYTHFARNINTESGRLSVAKGYTKSFSSPVPGSSPIHRLVMFSHFSADIYLAFCEDGIYCSNGGPWLLGYTYPTPLSSYEFDVVECKIGTVDYLVIGTGETPLIKFNGSVFTEFGSAECNSNHPVRYLSIFCSRLFSAGDPSHPNRLYWSKLPGDTRSIEDWGAGEASVNVEGGHIEVGSFDSDPIVAIAALSNQLLIFKKRSLYRLFGDKPSNFTLEEVESTLDTAAKRSIVHCGDVAYFMTASGMCVFDGVSAHICSDARCIADILKNANTTASIGAMTREKLYFTIEYDGECALLEYDIARRTYMLRDGFAVNDLLVMDNRLLLINAARYVYRFDEGTTYDGEPIVAEWTTPRTDCGEKAVIKQLRTLFLHADKNNCGTLRISAISGGQTKKRRVAVFANEITEIPLFCEGRLFSLKLENEAGSSFSLCGGIEVELGVRRRCT